VHDSLFFYTGGAKWTWNPQLQPFDERYLSEFYTHYDEDGRRWRRSDLTGDGIRKGDSGKPWRGIDVTAKRRHWAVPGGPQCLVGLEEATVQQKLDALDQAGLIHWPKKPDGVPMFKRYADQQQGVPLQSVWDDIPPLHNLAPERLGYPTQKPLALLNRIIKSSSNEGSVVLDAFCGCGTALVAAQQLNRKWIGIDISPTACRVMASRMREVCRLPENEKQWKAGKGFIVRDLPRSEAELRRIPPFEFENWAVIALGGIGNKAKVGDMGIDGRVFPASSAPAKIKDGFDFMDQWYPIQVKQKDKVGRPDIDMFEAVMTRENRAKGFFVSFAFTADALSEISSFFRKSGRVIVPLTVAEILEDQIAHKLA
jgi:site-specific DNA-methyltransferase (adenine-specific)